LSSLQFYYTTQKEILIPWKPALAEHLKTFEDLLVADRAGFIFEPEIGVHEQVAEFDFVSLYPNIMLKKNLSAETIRSSCCPDSKLKVPELQELQVEQIDEPLGKFAKNIISSIKGERENRKTKFDYKTKGMMAEIGKRTGVATILRFKLHGFAAWWLWRTYYLGDLPTNKEEIKSYGRLDL